MTYKNLKNLGKNLAKLRKLANWTQADMAEKLKVGRNYVSRIEKGQGTIKDSDIAEYLQALKTPEAEDYLNFLSCEWEYVLPSPNYEHPQWKELWEAEQYFQKLDTLLSKPELSKLLRNEAKLYWDKLQAFAEYLKSLEHSIAYIGNIGVGKTTVICKQTNLMLNPKDQLSSKQKKDNNSHISLQKRTVLATGKGRITVCEVSIQCGDDYQLNVEPMEEQIIYNLVELWCKNLDSIKNNNKDEKIGLNREIERLLENMTFPNSKNDSLLEELWEETGENLRETCSRVINLMHLESRTTSSIYPPQTSEKKLEWLRNEFKKINNGLNPGFSIPQTINITIPQKILNCEDYNLKLIDTRGIDDIAIREDLITYLRDDRAVCVLCSSFKEAPAISLINLMNHLISQGLGQVLYERVILLVITYPGDFLEVTNKEGEEVETEAEGKELKLNEVNKALKRTFDNIPTILFFNAESDDPREINEEIVKKVIDLRISKVSKDLKATQRAIDNLINNQDKMELKLAKEEVKKQLESSKKNLKLEPRDGEPIYNDLLEQIENCHQRTLWATTNRNGNWDNFDVYFSIAQGASKIALEWSKDTFNKLKYKIEDMLKEDDLKLQHEFLNVLLRDLNSCYQIFLYSVENEAKIIFNEELKNDEDIWNTCVNEYGKGSGFRNRVKRHLEDWFEEHDDLCHELDEKISSAFEEKVLNSLDRFDTDS